MKDDSLVDIMIAMGFFTQGDHQRARILSRDSGVSELEWLIRERKITPQQLFEAAKILAAKVSRFSGKRLGIEKTTEEHDDAGSLEPVDKFVGASECIKNLKMLIQKIAPTDATVLIQGESGAGKELVARAIHRLSRRSDRPFVTLNCSAIPSELIESELFGHKKGAFTGAIADHVGVFKASDQGTLFLDEIEATSPAMQGKLLRALQSGEIKPVGDEISSYIDVRFLCATNTDLHELAGQGLFREDLFFRISVFEVFVAPLRERSEDIPLLANHFLRHLAETSGRKEIKIDAPALELLSRYPWPGNVRELNNEIHRAFIMVGNGSTISVSCLSDKITRGGLDRSQRFNMHRNTLKETVEALERDLIQQALATSRGKRKEAARLLGLSRQGLLNKINKYKLSTP